MRNPSNKLTQLEKFLIFLLTVSLFFVQVKQLHMHFYDHYHHTIESERSATHSNHQSVIHSNYITSNFTHHNETIEVELSQKMLIIKLLLGALIAIFSVVFFFVLPPCLFNRKFGYIVEFIPLPKRYNISPPPRAPPPS